MRSHARLAVCSIALGLLLGCQHNAPPPVTAQRAPTDVQRDMATLAFLAYLGDELPASDKNAETTLTHCIENGIAAQGDDHRWKLVWGPVLYHFPIAKFDDNMMYVVQDQDTKQSSHFVVVVRGTNFSAVLDWLVEDFDVVDQVAWITNKAHGKPQGRPMISKATSEGLHILQEIAPGSGPYQGQNILTFLNNQAKELPSGLQIDVTGHSLGGALSPALALWLAEQMETPVQISVYPLAGPTPGNADFVAYYESVLGSSTHRLWNPYDVVPLAWNHETMGRMADLYEPLTRANPAERGLIDGLRSLVKDKGYSQIDPTHPSLSGAVSTDIGKKVDWLTEAGWQHHCGYQCALGIDVRTSTPECKSSTAQFLCHRESCPDPFEKKAK